MFEAPTPGPLVLQEPLTWLAWLIPMGLVLAVAGAAALLPRTSARTRWLLVAVAACAPGLSPSRGAMATFVMGMTVVTAARLVDVEHMRRRVDRLSLVFWLLLPVFHSFPHSRAERAENRRRAPRTLLRGIAKRLAWEPIAWLQLQLPAEAIPWPVRSILLMYFFVATLTALADLGLALCQLAGARTEEVFDWPLLSTSLRDFWGRRWNLFISRFTLKHIALPLRHQVPSSVNVLIVFFASGVFHEYFAWGTSGSHTRPGWMLAFFITQGLLVLLATRLPLPQRVPNWARITLTTIWLAVTSPAFFLPLLPALQDLQYQDAWYPWANWAWLG